MQDETKSCKHQSHGRTFVREKDKYLASILFDDKILKIS